MGRDKAAVVPGAAGGPTLSQRTADLMLAVVEGAVEVGPGFTTLDRATEPSPGRGPLAAVADGWDDLHRRGWTGPVVVVATDLPNLTVEILTWLTEHEPGSSVVPVAGGRIQPLCARYEPADLDAAVVLVESGARAMGALVAAIRPRCVPDEVWAPHAGRPDCLIDVDRPEDLDALRR
jgi:molybdopterin-guanine dinucleotide biosynthesis protein A